MLSKTEITALYQSSFINKDLSVLLKYFDNVKALKPKKVMPHC